MSLAKLKKRYQETILDGMARALWIEAFTTWSDANHKCRWCERAIFSQAEHGASRVSGEDLEWIDETGSGDCPDSDDGHEPAEGGASGIEREPGGDLDESTPDTPDAAYLAAHDLQKLLAASEGVKREASAMSELFEMAMTIHEGEPFQFGATARGDADSKELREAAGEKFAYAEEFGFDIAMESLGHGTGWGDDHVTKRGTAEFAPAIPRFEVHYDGEELTWSGVARDADRMKATKAPADDLARRGGQQARYVAEDEPITQGKLGTIVVVNGANAQFARHKFVVQIASSKFLVYEDNEQDALDETIDFISENEEQFGGLLADNEVNERYDELVAGGMGEEAAHEEAELDKISGGNYGNWLNSSEVHITKDPSREELYRMAGVAQNPPPGNPPRIVVCAKCVAPLDRVRGKLVDDRGSARCDVNKGGAHVPVELDSQTSKKKRGRKNPDVGDEWGEGGAESGELVMMVKDAVTEDPRMAIAAYEPEVFSPLSPEGIAERTFDANAKPIFKGAPNLSYPIPRSVFITLHPARAAMTLEHEVRRDYGEKLEGQLLITHATHALDNLVALLNIKWPMPNARWAIIPYGWGYIALTDNEDRADGLIDQPSESATFAIGLEAT